MIRLSALGFVLRWLGFRHYRRKSAHLNKQTDIPYQTTRPPTGIAYVFNIIIYPFRMLPGEKLFAIVFTGPKSVFRNKINTAYIRRGKTKTRVKPTGSSRNLKSIRHPTHDRAKNWRKIKKNTLLSNVRCIRGIRTWSTREMIHGVLSDRWKSNWNLVYPLLCSGIAGLTEKQTARTVFEWIRMPFVGTLFRRSNVLLFVFL